MKKERNVTNNRVGVNSTQSVDRESSTTTSTDVVEEEEEITIFLYFDG